MKIESGSSSYWAQSSKNRTESADVLAALAPLAGEKRVAEKASSDSPIGDLDFTNMTRKELFDWMNNQIRSGEMSLDESSPFLAMSLKVKPSGEPVDMNTDPTKLDFVDMAKRGSTPRNQEASMPSRIVGELLGTLFNNCKAPCRVSISLPSAVVWKLCISKPSSKNSLRPLIKV